MDIEDRPAGEPVDPRTEADAQIARAFQVVVDAGDEFDHAKGPKDRRDYAPDELDTLFFALSMAVVQLKKLPGGKEARDRFYRAAEGTLIRRGRRDLVTEADLDEEAVKIVKRTFGDAVDFAPGTTGRAFAQAIAAELKDAEALREKLLALAATIRQP